MVRKSPYKVNFVVSTIKLISNLKFIFPPNILDEESFNKFKCSQE
jgi:hypothetical protein